MNRSRLVGFVGFGILAALATTSASPDAFSLPPAGKGRPVLERDPPSRPTPTAVPVTPIFPLVPITPKETTSKAKACVDRRTTGALPARPAVAPPPPRFDANGNIVRPVGVSRQALAGQTDLMWDAGQTLRVKMAGGSVKVRNKVRQYAEEWTRYANIKFSFVDESQPAEVRISFAKDGTSWSAVGRESTLIPFGLPSMNFGWFDDDTSETELSRVVIHEFGHALGLIHEHQSPVAGIPWNKPKVYEDYGKMTPPWDRAKVDSQLFAKYGTNNTNFSQFDPLSIMEYFVPAEHTLDGKGIPGNTTLSAMDKQFIAQWYPQAPTASNSTGMLRTGDDCDQINFVVELNAVASDKVSFRLQPGPGITWWKAVNVPIDGGGYALLQMQDGRSDAREIARSTLDNTRPVRFGKAKFLGVHTPLGYTWDALSALPGGSRVTLTWAKDSCR